MFNNLDMCFWGMDPFQLLPFVSQQVEHLLLHRATFSPEEEDGNEGVEMYERAGLVRMEASSQLTIVQLLQTSFWATSLQGGV
eukprot:1157823-Amphidinium_carterae.1